MKLNGERNVTFKHVVLSIPIVAGAIASVVGWTIAESKAAAIEAKTEARDVRARVEMAEQKIEARDAGAAKQLQAIREEFNERQSEQTGLIKQLLSEQQSLAKEMRRWR